MYRHVVVKSYVECGRAIDLRLKDAALIIIVNVELATRALSGIEREIHKGAACYYHLFSAQTSPRQRVIAACRKFKFVITVKERRTRSITYRR